jgi:hypothetical protein
MSTGQIFLAMGAIILFGMTAMNVNRTYVSAIEEAILIQAEMDAIQYGQTLADEVVSNRVDYDDLATIYANLNDVSNVATRRTYVTPSLDTLYATIVVASEAAMLHGIMGKTVDITVFSKQDDTYRLRARYTVPMVNPN